MALCRRDEPADCPALGFNVTNPGDLVFDHSCGSGTTAFVAEKWGRRWITCESSRVSVTLAKQRLMTSLFDYYKLDNQDVGIAAGLQIRKSTAHYTWINREQRVRSGGRDAVRRAENRQLKSPLNGPFTLEASLAGRSNRSRKLSPNPSRPARFDKPHCRAWNSLNSRGSWDSRNKFRWRVMAKLSGSGSGATNCWPGESAPREATNSIQPHEPLAKTRWMQCEGDAGAPPESITRSSGIDAVHGGGGLQKAPRKAARRRFFRAWSTRRSQRQVESALEEAGQLEADAPIVVFAAFQFDPERPRTSTRPSGPA